MKAKASLCWGGRGSHRSRNTSSDMVAWQPCRTLGAEACLDGAVGLRRQQSQESSLPREEFFYSSPQNLGFQEQGRRRDSKKGGPSTAEQLCLLVEPSDQEKLPV